MRTTATTTTNGAPPESQVGHRHTHEDVSVGHGHTHTEEVATSPSDAAVSASVMLDIGAGLGALVIYPGERFRGREIEISRVDGPDDQHPIRPQRRQRGADRAGARGKFAALAELATVLYSDAISVADALAELHRCSGSQFDPITVEAFSKLVAQPEFGKAA